MTASIETSGLERRGTTTVQRHSNFFPIEKDKTSSIGRRIIQRIGKTFTSWKEFIQRGRHSLRAKCSRISTKHPKMIKYLKYALILLGLVGISIGLTILAMKTTPVILAGISLSAMILAGLWIWKKSRE